MTGEAGWGPRLGAGVQWSGTPSLGCGVKSFAEELRPWAPLAALWDGMVPGQIWAACMQWLPAECRVPRGRCRASSLIWLMHLPLSSWATGVSVWCPWGADPS